MDENEQAIKHIAAALGINRECVKDDELVGAIISEIVHLRQAYSKALDELLLVKQYVNVFCPPKGGDAP